MCGVLLEFTSGVTAAGLGIGVSIATGNPLAGAVVMGAQTSGNTYAREVASGKEADDARAYSLLVGIGTGTLQYLLGGIRAFGHSGGYGGKVAGKAGEALGGVVKQPVARSALNGIAKRMKEMGKEAFEEYVETTLEPVYRNLIYDEENELELLSVEALENAFVGALTAGALNLIMPESGGERNRTIEEDAAFGGRRRRGIAELTDGQADVDNALKRDIINGNESDYLKTYGLKGQDAGQIRNITLETLTRELLATKPQYSPVPEKWLGRKGSISVDTEGVWTYTNADGVSVRYPNGYPDFKGAGLVIQEIDIGEFVNRGTDIRRAQKLHLFKGIDDEYPLVWHHSEDGHTLQQIRKDQHEQFTHQGGIARIKRLNLKRRMERISDEY